MKIQNIDLNPIPLLTRGLSEDMASKPSSSSALDFERNKVKHSVKSGRAKSPGPGPGPPSSLDKRDPTSRSRRSRRPTDYGSDNHSNNSNTSRSRDYDFGYDYESATESLSSSLSSFPIDRNSAASSDNYSGSTRREKDHLKDESKRGAGTMRKKRTTGVLPSEGSTMIEVTKITALVEEELQSQRDKHKDQLNRTVEKFKDRREKFQEENDSLREERDEARKELDKCKKSHVAQRRAAERNDRLQSQQKNRIESLEEQRELFEDLQEERDALLDEVARAQQQQQQTKEELSGLKVRVREDSAKRLSVMECLSTSWDSEQKEAKQKEALLNSELDIMSKTLKAEQDYLKGKSKEFSQLEESYRSTKTELRSMKMTMMAKKEEMDLEIKRERESHKRVCEEHKHDLKQKNDEIYMAETTIRTMKTELKSTRERFNSKEDSMASMKEEMKKHKEKSDVVVPEVKVLREENNSLQAEIKELQKQVESYLANMALQQEFCDSLKSRIYKEQESEQEKVQEVHKLRKRIKKQQKEAVEKDLQIDQLKQLLGDNSAIGGLKVQSKSSKELTAAKKSSLKKPKSTSRKGGYRST